MSLSARARRRHHSSSSTLLFDSLRLNSGQCNTKCIDGYLQKNKKPLIPRIDSQGSYCAMIKPRGNTPSSPKILLDRIGLRSPVFLSAYTRKPFSRGWYHKRLYTSIFSVVMPLFKNRESRPASNIGAEHECQQAGAALCKII